MPAIAFGHKHHHPGVQSPWVISRIRAPCRTPLRGGTVVRPAGSHGRITMRPYQSVRASRAAPLIINPHPIRARQATHPTSPLPPVTACRLANSVAQRITPACSLPVVWSYPARLHGLLVSHHAQMPSLRMPCNDEMKRVPRATLVVRAPERAPVYIRIYPWPDCCPPRWIPDRITS